MRITSSQKRWFLFGSLIAIGWVGATCFSISLSLGDTPKSTEITPEETSTLIDLSDLVLMLDEHEPDQIVSNLTVEQTSSGKSTIQLAAELASSDNDFAPIHIAVNPLRGSNQPTTKTTSPSDSTSKALPPRTTTITKRDSDTTPKKNTAKPASAIEDPDPPLELFPDDSIPSLQESFALPTEESPTDEVEIEQEQKDTPADVPAKGQTKPRPRMVQIKPLTQEEQESPSLRSIESTPDPSTSKAEDERAISGSRPQKSENPKSNTAPSGKLPPILSAEESRRRLRVENCLAYYLANPESATVRSPWAVMHAMLPFGVESEITVGNQTVNSIQWMCYNGTCRTQKLFTPVGRTFRPNIGGGVQGHEGQFLAMLAQSQVASNYPIVVGPNRFTIEDLVKYEMATCKPNSELTFKLIGLSYYLDTNQAWRTNARDTWNIERLVSEELAQPIIGSACGGTHRLMGLSFAVKQRQLEGRPISGHYARAKKFVDDFIEYTWTLQNPDGSFSTNWFEARGNEPNSERKVQTTGHILEWLMFALPDDELDDPRIRNAIDYLLTQIWDRRDHNWPIGPRGHATRAVALYQQRIYKIEVGTRKTELARQIDSLRTNR